MPLLKSFSEDFFLAGDTAIRLCIGHRKSIDFDLFSNEEFDNLKIKRQISQPFKIDKTLASRLEEYTILVNNVKITFLQYPFEIKSFKTFGNIIRVPELLTLAAMKAYALGGRAKWKDYVDIYYILKDHFSIKEISKRGEKIFKDEFNEKLFRSQLAYFEDIDYSEKIIYLKGFEVDNEVIKKELIKFSLS